MITLYNVMDIRTNNIYSVVRVNSKKAKWFVPAPEPEEETPIEG